MLALVCISRLACSSRRCSLASAFLPEGSVCARANGDDAGTGVAVALAGGSELWRGASQWDAAAALAYVAECGCCSASVACGAGEPLALETMEGKTLSERAFGSGDVGAVAGAAAGAAVGEAAGAATGVAIGEAAGTAVGTAVGDASRAAAGAATGAAAAAGAGVPLSPVASSCATCRASTSF